METEWEALDDGCRSCRGVPSGCAGLPFGRRVRRRRGRDKEVRGRRPSDQALAAVYAEMVVAYVRVVRVDREGVRRTVIDHLIGRVDEARNGEIAPPLVEIVDRLHAEITAEPAPA